MEGGDGIEVAKMVDVEPKHCDRDDDVTHLALDIGGSLIKMVYFSSSGSCCSDDQKNCYSKDGIDAPNGTSNPRGLRGRLNFLKFETSKISECIKFISSKQLQHYGLRKHDNNAPIPEI